MREQRGGAGTLLWVMCEAGAARQTAGEGTPEEGCVPGTRKLTWLKTWAAGEEGEERGRLGPDSEGWQHPTIGFKGLWEMLAGNDRTNLRQEGQGGAGKERIQVLNQNGEEEADQQVGLGKGMVLGEKGDP